MPSVEDFSISNSKAAAIRRVIRQIDLYQGEEIVKEAHPLWMTVVALEKMCRQRQRGDFRLHTPASGQWYRGLWASRDGMRNVPLTARMYEIHADRTPGPPDPQLAMAWMQQLKQTLQSWLRNGTCERELTVGGDSC